ncbi:MAG: MarR family winged helix-turn-helix transcriptional regulator [Clostridiales bacterium]|jgi:DNA-binding MarR family transcriptional regulator|nr:MarR family winged helix-turn-helix transcriptional regulator [Clostridiales bacterium]
MIKKSILYEVKALSNLIGSQTERVLAEGGEDNPTGMQGFIIGYLGDSKDKDVFQRDVESEFQISRATATSILQRMEKNGFIERHSVDFDARLKKLVLTPKANRSYESVMRIIRGIDEKALEGLTEVEIEVFRTVLRKMQINLEQGEVCRRQAFCVSEGQED